MNSISPDIRRFALRLTECERHEAHQVDLETILNVCGKLKHPLTVLMGQAGYRAFLGRALALTSAEIPWLRALHVNANASLASISDSETKITPDDLNEGGLVFIAQLLALLAAFMGEAILVRILREAWPEVNPRDFDFRNEL